MLVVNTSEWIQTLREVSQSSVSTKRLWSGERYLKSLKSQFMTSLPALHPRTSWLWLDEVVGTADDIDLDIAVDSRRWLLVTGVRKSSLMWPSPSLLNPSWCATSCGVLFRRWLFGSRSTASLDILAIACSADVRSGLPSDGNKLDGENSARF